ncbi:MAG: putative DNA binding domain-containing protein [Candidatus Krumholzibacteria bacterium]|jgi:ATP-dependent DNA helicase RecG|nr:putative DNA binding domain-containing protein [Candidatus Krumholzibacteria bacterium]MDP6796276.1 putative DNA binding domain-containing protein [Candidatus Krumholzibacteria bacterium]MDP7022180.1 putative DNA binding domain-containing protein [Candidatus Krumholzibacteria bacterium]
MESHELEILLQEGEGAQLEFKESLSSSFARELVAFANSSGGRILLGVSDNGTVLGVADTNNLRGRIQDVARNCDPPVRIHVERVGEVTVVSVQESEIKPVQCRDGFFWRQGAVTQKLSREEIRTFFQQEQAIQFDLALCAGFTYPDDFDHDKFNRWLKLSNISSSVKTEDILVNIDVAERVGDGLQFRNAGVIFFAKDVRRFFKQAYITCLLGKGHDKVHVLDRKDFDGGVVDDIEDALHFVERNTRTAWRIEGLQRENIPEYPMNAVREAITNAVMHRDWFIEGGMSLWKSIQIGWRSLAPGHFPRG